eukprot:Protomagalhaensia_sp_Gyna_25__3193@NODE_290_length_4034_cov_181_182979_g224_i0_p2_GENE_NODE_290_length_4034_cov_181_182979_g224_i0NODE_290_length_4034_cov_181_182979_g224_i0_p2_ORF_typecomplete_len267_score50_15SDA1/PF05285_12/3_6e05YL1/PF05764_13/0_00013Herpes_LMP1/PF05297_11/0_2eIF3c_N/PF05470_12/0_34DNA_pol_phi/PF04931_13/1_3Pes10/PF07149_11/1_6TLP20/PF06088_11/1_5TLP20/PF06088_11/1e03CobT/PF06213_12/0_11CobT/PF06213_12/7_4e02_NODE_290_length_4034_cov_181_182979_g224_i04691269
MQLRDRATCKRPVAELLADAEGIRNVLRRLSGADGNLEADSSDEEFRQNTAQRSSDRDSESDDDDNDDSSSDSDSGSGSESEEREEEEGGGHGESFQRNNEEENRMPEAPVMRTRTRARAHISQSLDPLQSKPKLANSEPVLGQKQLKCTGVQTESTAMVEAGTQCVLIPTNHPPSSPEYHTCESAAIHIPTTPPAPRSPPQAASETEVESATPIQEDVQQTSPGESEAVSASPGSVSTKDDASRSTFPTAKTDFTTSEQSNVIVA